MKANRIYHRLMIFLLIILSACILLALCMGRFILSVPDALQTLYNGLLTGKTNVDLINYNVIFHLRLARVLGAILVGGALSVSGSTYQSIFRNPLAAPELLGVFQGACIGAAAAILLHGQSSLIQSLALIGGLVAVQMTLFLTRFFHNQATATLVLAGVIVSGLLRSIFGILKYAADPETQLPSITYWELGSLADLNLATLGKIAPVMIFSFVLLYLLRWRFNLLSLGDDEAKVLGENVKGLRFFVIFFATLLTSCAVCLGGNILWIGLIIPQLGRLIVGPDNTRLFPIVAVMGAIFLVIVDTLSRTLTGVELPLSILTGIIGTPIFIILIIKSFNKGV